MGTRITVGNWPFEALSFSVQEDATPIAGDDTSGSVGTITFDIPQPDPDLNYVNNTGSKAINTYGPDILLDQPISLRDTRRGFTLGTVSAVNRNDDGATLSITCATRLGLLNAYGIQAQPFVGSLAEAFEYYLGLVDIDTDLLVDPLIANRQVVNPGWYGELWYHLKMMAIAQDCDISLVSGVIVLRPIRVREVTRGRDISRGRDVPIPTLARAVEVYKYDNTPITNQLVYPPGGWTPETEVMNVNAGEEAEYVLELSASVSSIQQPTHQTFVSEDHDLTSVYTVVANDGFPISADAWTGRGGSLKVSINPDTQSLTVRLRGPVGLPLTSGSEPATNFSIALGSDTTGNRYSTFRIVGTGVRFNKTKKRIRTGVPDSKTGTDVGVTIDNPFISTHEDMCRAGTRAAKRFAGPIPTLSGSVISVNRLGDTGDMTLPRYGEVQTALSSQLVNPSYGDVEDHYATLGLTTYGQVQDYWFEFVRDDFANQVFGNVAGARIQDLKSRRWYRIRTATPTPGTIQFSAEDDLTHGDMEGFHISRTYGDVQLVLSGLSYRQAELVGMYAGT